MKPSRNQAGPHRPAPAAPPIDPTLTYPFRRLADWGFGARTIAMMQRRGLKVLRFSKWKFVRGVDLVDFLERVGGPVEGEAQRCNGCKCKEGGSTCE